jgi:dipeptidyl aminopeptidase/acylaminoacyl peptidase
MRLAFFSLGLVVLLLAQGLAQDPENVLTTADVIDLANVSGAHLSPDGKTIAYTVSRPRAANEKDGPSRTTVRLIGFDGKGDRPFMSHAAGASGLRWRADGTGLYFLAKRTGDQARSLYEISLSGGEARRILSAEESIRSFSVSGDGRRVAYTLLSAEDPQRAKEKARGFDRIVFEEEERKIELRVRELESGEEKSFKIEGAPWDPTFDPNGNFLALWVSPSGRIDDRYMKRKLYMLDVATGTTRRLVDNPGKVGNFAWCPSGRCVAYVTAQDANDPKEGVIGVVDVASGESKIITPRDFPGHVSSVAWIDDENLAFLTAEGTETTLSRQAAEGGEIAVELRSKDRVWASFSSDASGKKFALVGDAPTHPRELYTFIPGGKPAERRTVVNPTIENLRFAKQRVVSYPARDKLRIEGILIEPLDRKEGERYPLIVVVHGGPEAHYGNGWLTRYSMPGQVAAARGYAVFYPNYRSSTGRGLEFSKAGQQRSALEEFNDIVDGVDYLVETEGLVDTKRVGITGGSYGGYASAWAATKQSERFAASVMFVGISDQISKVFTTDIPNESYLVHWRMRPWDDNWLKFLESSPIYYIKNAKTPILICHGEDDPRVSPTQSMELYRALKIKGDVPVRLVLYPGEGHGNRRRASQLDYALRQMRWFEHFLDVEPTNEKPSSLIQYGN